MKNRLKKYKRPLLATIIFLIILAMCIVNIFYSFKYRDQNTNVFATISGWLGVISTIILGLITLWQSKKYTTSTMKISLTNDIRLEEEKFLELSECLINFTSYIQPLENIVGDKTENDFLKYKWQTDNVFENMLKSVRSLQLYKYIPNQMEDLVQTISKYSISLHNNYKEALKLKEENKETELAEQVTEITNQVKEWILELSQKRNETIKGICSLVNLVDEIHNVGEIERFIKQIDEKTSIATKKSNTALDEMVAKMRENNEEKNNG